MFVCMCLCFFVYAVIDLYRCASVVHTRTHIHTYICIYVNARTHTHTCYYLFVTDRISARGPGLGRLAQFEDAALLVFLDYFTPTELCVMAGVSKVVYVFTHNSDVWKERVLDTLGGDFSFYHTWRDSYLKHMHPEATKGVLPHKPLQVRVFLFSCLWFVRFPSVIYIMHADLSFVVIAGGIGLHSPKLT